MDDDVRLLGALARMLEPLGDVRTAATVAEAIRILETADIDCILSDDRMGAGPRGARFLAFVRDNYPGVIRILMSGDDVPSDRSVERTWEHFLAKPFARDAVAVLLAGPSDRV